jgi:hypothetical protein
MPTPDRFRQAAAQTGSRQVRRAVKYILGLAAAFIGMVTLLLAWSFHADQQRFRAAKNDCERGCIQDSGGLEDCRKICVDHPNRYP